MILGLGGAKTGGFGAFGTQTGSTPASGVGLSSLSGGFGGQAAGGTLSNFGSTAATGAGSGFSFSNKTTGKILFIIEFD